MAANDILDSRDFSKPTIGYVKSASDPLQNGRLKIFCPTIDFEDTPIEDLPWARYCTPFGGVISNYPSGPEGEISYGPNGYGMWAIPKIGAEVLVVFINGDPNLRVWTGCLYSTQANRSLPGGRNMNDNSQPGPWTDSYEEYQPLHRNIKLAGLGAGTHYETRGKERAVAQAKTEKDGADGYAKNPVSGELESQTFAFTTPGHNMIVMSDSPDNCRIRMRTAGGMQAILDDTNERIYFSTSAGNTWFEMDQDGHVHMFGAQSISLRAGVDINLAADRYINMQAKEGINIKSECCVTIDAGNNIMSLAGGSIYHTATGGSIANNASGCILNTGSQIHFNSDDSSADMASGASGPSVIPSKEPWVRPASATKRNSNWKA